VNTVAHELLLRAYEGERERGMERERDEHA
jgi:hypothetical protein